MNGVGDLHGALHGAMHRVVRPGDEVDDKQMPCIFLVGPTPRSPSVPSWRPEALEILISLGFKGTVFVPEVFEMVSQTYIDQIDWEDAALTLCSQRGCVAAWVPRELETMPAFTTNVEFGLYLNCGRFVYGRPDGAPKTAYLDRMYEKRVGGTPHSSLRSLLEHAIKRASS